ncbi:MAG TPA: YqgE/AlgH family protein [Xanthobacteraceae bacterium]|nr:YqgE/AlgH family protein [Xanthobacteraceae bacterium]
MPHATRNATLSLLMRRGLMALAALALPALLLGAVAPSATEPPTAPPPPSLAGQLLIAPPEMRDPRFDHTVILVVRHDKSGALGIVINMPAGERPIAELLAAIGEKGDVSGTVPVYVGGPVEPDRGLVLHSADYHAQGTIDVDGHVAMTASAQILRDIAAKNGPQKSLVTFGYAGWGAGQLDNEMARNVWYKAPEDPKLVFDEDRAKVWERAMARRTQDL